MLKVRLTKFHIGDVFGYVGELRAQGYKQGVDFDFAYYPDKYSDDGWGLVQERAVEFMFYDEQLGLLFKLGKE
jgi:hypothetical protein